MTEDVSEHIFDAFFTTRFTGRGLGMAAVLGIIRSHFGSIILESRSGEGTRIRIILPVADAKVMPVAANSTDQSMDANYLLSNYSALIIDDEVEIISSLAHLLEIQQIKVEQAASGKQALQLLDAHKEPFDLVFLDMNMPEMSGAEVYAELQQRKISSRMILMSGYNEQEINASISALTVRPAKGNQGVLPVLVASVSTSNAEIFPITL